MSTTKPSDDPAERAAERISDCVYERLRSTLEAQGWRVGRASNDDPERLSWIASDAAIIRAEYAPLILQLDAMKAQIADLVQTSGDLCESCGWRGERGDGCAFCQLATANAEIGRLKEQIAERDTGWRHEIAERELEIGRLLDERTIESLAAQIQRRMCGYDGEKGRIREREILTILRSHLWPQPSDLERSESSKRLDIACEICNRRVARYERTSNSGTEYGWTHVEAQPLPYDHLAVPTAQPSGPERTTSCPGKCGLQSNADPAYGLWCCAECANHAHSRGYGKECTGMSSSPPATAPVECPFCGSSDVQPYSADTAVICNRCHAHGPITDAGGVASWNVRSQLTDLRAKLTAAEREVTERDHQITHIANQNYTADSCAAFIAKYNTAPVSALLEAIRRVKRRGHPYKHEAEQIILGCLYDLIIKAAQEVGGS